MNDDGGITIILILLGAAFVYMLPTILAFKKGYKHKFSILIANVFVGLTGLGWFYLLSIVMNGREGSAYDRGYRPSPYKRR